MRLLTAIRVIATAAVALAAVGDARAAATFVFFEASLADGASHALPTPSGTGLVADLSPDRRSVLYRNGGTLTIARIDGSDAHAIVDVPHQIDAATWSPNGRMIAFEIEDTTACAVPRCGRFQIWLVGRNGSGRHEFADNAVAPAWSRDSRRLAFINDYDTATSAGKLSVASIDGTGLRALTGRDQAVEPRWSSNGRLIAYTRVVAAGHRDVVRVVPVSRPRLAWTLARGDAPVWLGQTGLLVFSRYVRRTAWLSTWRPSAAAREGSPKHPRFAR